MNKKVIIYAAIIILVLAVLAAALLFKKCAQYYDPVSKESSGDCYSVWQRGFWGSYGSKEVSAKQAEMVASEAIKKFDRVSDSPIVIGAAKFWDGAWWVVVDAHSSRGSMLEAGRTYWVNIDAKKGKVLKIIPLEYRYFGEVTLELDKGVFFERGQLLVAVESISKVIMEDPFDEVYSVKLVVADREELSAQELWLSSTGASERGKDKLNWRGYSIRVIAADEKVPSVKLTVNKLN